MKSRVWAFKLSLCLFLLGMHSAFAMDIRVGDLRLNKKVKSIRQLRDHNVVRQSLDYSCGAAGLATILKYGFADAVEEKEIIKKLLTSDSYENIVKRHGFSLLDLKKFAEARGYNAIGYKMDVDFLRNLNAPVLAPIKFKQFRHFVVVKGVIGDRIYLADPALGNITMKKDRFTSIWQGGVGLVIERKNQKDNLNKGGFYFLKPDDKDATFADYKGIMRFFQASIMRTAVFPDEF